VSRPELVVGRFAAHGKPGNAAAFAQRVKAIAPPAQDLMDVGLVRNVPDELIARKIEHAVQRNRQLDHA